MLGKLYLLIKDEIPVKLADFTTTIKLDSLESRCYDYVGSNGFRSPE
jgi:hypothetical protein